MWTASVRENKLEKRVHHIWRMKKEAYQQENGHLVHCPKLQDVMSEIIASGCEAQEKELNS
jgi:hypothetical protein